MSCQIDHFDSLTAYDGPIDAAASAVGQYVADLWIDNVSVHQQSASDARVSITIDGRMFRRGSNLLAVRVSTADGRFTGFQASTTFTM